jgi:hypothetical protein
MEGTTVLNPPRIAGRLQGVLDAVKSIAQKPGEAIGQLNEGWKLGTDQSIEGDANSVIDERTGYKEAFNRSIPEGIGYTAGRVTGDWGGDGSRAVWWRYNNLGAIANEAAKKAGEKWAGLSPADKRSAMLLGTIPTLSLVSTSGNFDVSNLGELGREKGYAAVFPDEDDPTKSTNPVGELAARYVLGQRGSILPVQKFLEERPEMTALDHRQIREFQRDKGLGGVGVLSGTMDGSRNNPEIKFLGFNAPLDALGATALATVGTIGYLRGKKMLGDKLNQMRLNNTS